MTRNVRRTAEWPLAKLAFERSDDVLWTIAPPGALLHNFVRREFIQLNALGYRLWGFLDGARPAAQVVKRSIRGSASSPSAMKQAVKQIEALAAHGFIIEVPRHGTVM